MKVISLLSRKGGSGKSTLTIHWAVESKGKTVIIDMDPQGSVIAWFMRREKETPVLIKSSPGELKSYLKVCKKEGIDNVFIDTMPDINRSAVVAAKLSDLVVIPTKPLIMDLESITGTIDLVNQLGKKAVVILNQVPNGSNISNEAREMLADQGVDICPVDIKQRLLFARAGIRGQTAGEVEKKSKSAKEIKSSYKWIREQIK